MNGLPGVLRLQKEQLCHYQTGVLISNLHTSNVHHILKLIPRPHCDSMGMTQQEPDSSESLVTRQDCISVRV